MTDDQAAPPFYRIGPDRPVTPVILSVPHAGRAYSAALLRAARVPVNVLEALEDRLVDRLVWRAVAAGATAIVATAPRAEIDLNRDERELDPAMVAPPPPSEALMSTMRTRGGLGLVPARLAGAGGLWRGRMSRDELTRRVETIHRPYHAAVASALTGARKQFGTAVLLDCHSMPPRPRGQQAVVIGDRHGRSAAPWISDLARRTVEREGFTAGFNDPYAGGWITESFGRPDHGVHALQLELDRSLYLDGSCRRPGPEFDRIARLLETLAVSLADALLRRQAIPDAAE
jgi:N-formylglutamate amidohydrolase